MNAMILAAGLGTRLKPWTLNHPKALVPVGGIPMLERVIVRLRDEGFSHIVVNVHHFAEQILDFLKTHDFGVDIHVSDESNQLLDTGGALLHASALLSPDNSPCLIHNVDILSNAPLGKLMKKHIASESNISLLTSSRESSRKLIFNKKGILEGWHNLNSDEYRPEGFYPSDSMHEHAFSGIYIVDALSLAAIDRYATQQGTRKFPVMDFLLSRPAGIKISEQFDPNLQLIDIGKPETLRQAETLFK